MSNKISELNSIIDLGNRAREVLESRNWKEIFEPLLDNMIIDVLGGKIDGRWVNGAIDKVEEVEEKLRYLQAYKAALVSVHSAFYQLIDDADAASESLKQMIVTGSDEYEGVRGV